MAEMEDESWLFDLAFLVDIITRINELNTSLQRKAQYASEMYGHIKDFINKLRLWHAHMQNANLSHFPTLKEMGMRPEKRQNLQINLKYCLMNFRPASKILILLNIYLEYFLHHFTQTLAKSPLISKWN